jgi:hypothetical protein
MRNWLAVLNIIAGAFILFCVSIAHNQIKVNERDFQSEVLAEAIDKSNEYAFVNSLKYSSLNQEYDELNTLTIDPTNVIRDFETMMCLCYNMALSEENLNLVGSCIDGGVLCDSDGYYILQIADEPVIMDSDGKNYKIQTVKRKAVTYDSIGAKQVKEHTTQITNNVSKELSWSLKLPYSYTLSDGTYALNIANGDSLIYTGISGNQIVRTNGISDRVEEPRWYRQNNEEIQYYKVSQIYTYQNASGGTVNPSLLNDSLKIQRINNILSTAINESIKSILEARGIQMNYTVYLPANTTQSGVNPVRTNTLLISMSKASFAGQYASLSEPVLSGFRAVSKEYLVRFKDEDGIDRYCYASQLPSTITRDAMYYSAYEAIMDTSANNGAGCRPSFKYIQYPLLRELQTVD